MTPRLRKVGLTAHITVSVGWLGAVAAFLALSVTSLTSRDAETVRAVYLAMNLIGRFVIVPLSVTALATGLVQALGTEWGLFRHSWILVKLLLTIFSTVVLIAKIPLMDRAARLAAEVKLPSADLHDMGIQLLVHSAGGLVVLLVITILSVFKPWGITRFGLRKQQQRHESSSLIISSSGPVAKNPESPRRLETTPALTPPSHLDPSSGITADPLLRRKILVAVICLCVLAFVILHFGTVGLGGHSH